MRTPAFAPLLNRTVLLFLLTASFCNGRLLASPPGNGSVSSAATLPSLSANSPKVIEGNAGAAKPALLNFQVKLSNKSDRVVTVYARTVAAVNSPSTNSPSTNSPATVGTDFTALTSTQLSFAPGETSKVVPVKITGDSTYEADERVGLELSNPVNAQLLATPTIGEGIILDDDAKPSLSIDDVALAEGNRDLTNFKFLVSLSSPSGLETKVNFATTSGTALAGTDFKSQSGALVFAPGQTSKAVTVKVIGETKVEEDESFQVGLNGAVNATLVKSSATGTILNDDKVNFIFDGWCNDAWIPESLAVYKSNTDLFADLNPFYYNLGLDVEDPGNKDTSGSIFERDAYRAADVDTIHAYGAKCVPTISDKGTGQINAILANATARRNLIDNLVNKAIKNNFDGFDLDFESGDERGTGKQLYTDFVSDLAAALKAESKVLDITIGAFEDRAHEKNWIMDISTLRKVKDVRYFKILAYDKFFRNSQTPGPNGDITWVRDCLDYMVKQRGLPAEKTLLGITNISWVWQKTAQDIWRHTTKLIIPFPADRASLLNGIPPRRNRPLPGLMKRVAMSPP